MVLASQPPTDILPGGGSLISFMEHFMNGKVKLPKTLSANEISALWGACRTSTERCLLSLLFSGLRLRECRRMTKADVGDSYIMARRTVEAESRRVPLSAQTLLLLNNIGDREHVWLKPGGEPMDSRGLERLYNSMRHRSGIPKENGKPRVARNTAALHFLLDGGHPNKLRDLLGVENVTGLVTLAIMSVLDVARTKNNEWVIPVRADLVA